MKKENKEEKKKKVIAFWAIVFVFVIAGVALKYFIDKASVKENVCESIQPGATETDMLLLLGKEDSRTENGAYTDLVYSSDSSTGPVHARSNSKGDIIWLKCSEYGKVNWTTK